MSRKRRRSQAFPQAEDEEAEVTRAENETENAATEESEETEETEAHRLEREVWYAVREEHFEIIDQVPLTLHRQYTLMRELDQQTHGYMDDLLPTLMKYIAHRRNLASQTQPVVVTQSSEGDADSLNQDADVPAAADSPSILSLHIPRILLQADPAGSLTPTGLPAERKKSPQTGREMLSSIAWLTEELVSAAQEKVNLAQAAHDYIDRQIRVLSQSIKEQEMAISFGVRPGTQLAPILLPEVVPLARWTKATAGGLTLDDEDDNAAGSANIGIAVDEAEQPPAPAPRHRRRKGRPPRQPQEIQQQATSLKIILPAMQSTELYCYCNKPSSGEMVACDDENCEIEWFHLECTGLTQLPEEQENWFCDNCQPKKRKGRR